MKISAQFRKKSGFSLLELAVVTAVIGIMLTISGPKITDFLKKQRSDEVISQLYMEFLNAKSEALKRQNDVIMTFDVENNTYSVLYDDNSDWKIGDALTGGDVYLKQDVPLPANYVFASKIFGIYGVDNEGIGLGVTFKNNLVYFQPTGRISDEHADTLDTLVKQNNRTVYVIREGDPDHYDYHHLRALAVNGLAGQPEMYFYDYALQTWRTYD